MAIFINGKKMACDPCIRGHRSSKCDHAKERLLLEVRKPGRPLSQCPHTTSLCDCSRSATSQTRVQVALNRKSAKKCPCGLESTNTAFPSNVAEPPLPTKHTFKVDKSITSSHQVVRKQPDLDSYVDRIDQSHVNIIAPYQNRSIQPIAPALINENPVIVAHNSLNSFIQLGFSPPAPHYTPWQSIGDQFNGNGYKNGEMNGEGNGTGNYKPSSHVKMDSGVSGFTMPMETPSLSAHSSVNFSDCPTTPMGNDLGATQYLQDSYQQMEPAQILIAPFGYPSPYSTHGNATPDPQWHQSSVYAQSARASFDTPTSSPYQALAKTNGDITPDDDMLHNCSCGDGCNCLGCIVHPHNSRTTAYIQSSMREQWDETLSLPAKYDSNSTDISSPETGTADDVILNAADYQFEEFLFQCQGIKSACQCPEGCECSGCLTHNGDFCWGETGECPCGPECECVGCTVHGNAPQTEERDEEDDEAPKPSCCQ